MYHEKEKAATGLEPVTAKPFLPNPYLDYFDKLEFILQLETIYLVYGSVSFPSYTNAFISVFSSTSA